MIYLKSSVVFFAALMLVNANAQNGTRRLAATNNILENTTWKVDGVPFETKEREEYSLQAIVEESQFNWGHSISFAEKTFTSSYSAPCGNDCFTNVYGEYQFVDAYLISIKIIKIDRGPFCSQKSESLNQNYGKYKLEKAGNGWQIIKEQ